jgi:hypothetical protein
MNSEQETKSELCNQLRIILDRKLDETLGAINSLKESRDSDSKSSAGDKHETSRAMMQIELDKCEVQLANLVATKNDLERIDLQKNYLKAEPGSLLITNQGNYFISIGIGKLDIGDTSYFAISLASPLGIALKDKLAGDKIQFQGKEFIITEIV